MAGAEQWTGASTSLGQIGRLCFLAVVLGEIGHFQSVPRSLRLFLVSPNLGDRDGREFCVMGVLHEIRGPPDSLLINNK